MMQQSAPTLSPFSMLAGMSPVASGTCAWGHVHAACSVLPQLHAWGAACVHAQ